MVEESVAVGDPPQSDPPEPRKAHGLRNVIEWVCILLGALLVAFLVKSFLLQAFYIPSASMSPTLKVHDRVLVNKLSYDFHDVNRGDVIVFESPPGGDTDVKDLIKRVIALPGETVEGRDDKVFIDGQPLDEPYTHGLTTSPFPAQTVPAGHYWMMGDNRPNSRDSRYFGPIDQSSVVGRAFVKVWPLGALGLL